MWSIVKQRGRMNRSPSSGGIVLDSDLGEKLISSFGFWQDAGSLNYIFVTLVYGYRHVLAGILEQRGVYAGLRPKNGSV